MVIEPDSLAPVSGLSPKVLQHPLSTQQITGSLGYISKMEEKSLSFLPPREIRRSDEVDKSILKLSLQTNL